MDNFIESFAQMPLSVQPGHAPGLKTNDRPPRLVFQQLAKLIETAGPRVPPARYLLSEHVLE